MRLKKNICMLLIMSLICTLCPVSAFANTDTTQNTLTTSDGNFEYKVSDEGVTIEKYLGDDTEVSIPQKIDGKIVTDIGFQAFFDCRKLSSIEIPDGVKSIGTCAFQFCTSLTSIELPDGLESIALCAFNYCTSLTSIELPDGVISIIDYAFGNCPELINIEIPSSVTYIADNAFEGCEKITILCENDSYAYNYAIQNKIAYKLIEEPTEFTIGRDNNMFAHSKENFFSNGKNATYRINSSKYRDALLYNQSSNYKNRLIKRQDNKWTGACFGLSTAMVYAYKNKFDIKPYLQEDCEDYPYFSVCNYPFLASNMLDLLHTFQLSQFRSDMSYTDITYKNGWSNFANKGSSLEKFLKGVVQQAAIANFSNPFLIGCTFDNSGHCVVVLGLADGEDDDYYKIAVCDPNGSPIFDENGKAYASDHKKTTYIIVKKDYTECYYTNYEGVKIEGSGFDSSDFKELKYFTLEDAYSGNSKKQNVDLAECEITIDMKDSFLLKTDTGTYLSYDGNEFHGNLEVEEITSTLNDVNNEKTFMSIKLSNVNKIEFSQLAENTEIECLFNDTEYINVSGNNLENITFQENNGVEIEGDNSTYKTTIASQDKDNTLIQVSGTTSSKIILSYDDNNIKMSGDTSNPTINKLTEDGITDLEKSDPKITINNSTSDSDNGDSSDTGNTNTDNSSTNNGGDTNNGVNNGNAYNANSSNSNENNNSANNSGNTDANTPGSTPTSGNTPSHSDASASGNTPSQNDTPTPSSTPTQNDSTNAKAQKVGDKVTVEDTTYTITNIKKKEVSYTKTKSKADNLTVPATVKISGTKYKVTKVADNAFAKNKKVTQIAIGKNVTVIGKNAFKGCVKLKNITIPANVKTIGANAFSGDKKLTALTITSGKLTKKNIKNALKGSSIKIIKLKDNAKKRYKKYCQYFKKSNCGRSVKLKK